MRNLISLILLVCSFTSFASSRIESWKNGESIKFVVRNDKGHFVTYGDLQLENWNDADNRSEWIARHEDGSFVTGYRGYLEKFKVPGLSKEQIRLVIRNKKGAFVTWKAMDELLTAGFEKMDIDRDGNKETIYAIRYNNSFVNWSPARLEKWKNFEFPVLVVRDTADSSNNGKLMAWIVAERTSRGTIIYRDPETGKFLSPNK